MTDKPSALAYGSNLTFKVPQIERLVKSVGPIYMPSLFEAVSSRPQWGSYGYQCGGFKDTVIL